MATMSFLELRQMIFRFRHFIGAARQTAEQMRCQFAFLEKGVPVLRDGFPQDLIREAHRLRERASVLRRLVQRRLERCRESSHSRALGHRLPNGEVIEPTPGDREELRRMLDALEREGRQAMRTLEITERVLALAARRMCERLKRDDMRHTNDVGAGPGNAAQTVEVLRSTFAAVDRALQTITAASQAALSGNEP